MIDPKLWRQTRRLWVRAKRAVASHLSGSQRSLFRGAGLAFEEVRPYEPGDDVRAIDWNVTARSGQPFVKRYIEERELPWLLLLDVSRSMGFGTAGKSKRDAAAELAALAAAAALHRGDRIGLLLFSDRVEAWLPPRKGGRAALRLLHASLFHEPKSPRTRLTPALRFAARLAPRRSLILVLSDFAAEEPSAPLRQLGRRHDLVAVQLTDERERSWPEVGLLAQRDAESGRRLLVDSAAAAALAAERHEERTAELRRRLQEADAALVEADAAGGGPQRLLDHFRLRASRRGRRR